MNIPPLPDNCNPIPDYPGYCAHSDGYILSCHNNKWGYSPTWRKLHPGVNNKFGRQVVVLVDKTGKHCTFHVHRIVLMAFVGPCPDGMEACHNDGDASNNSLSNLRWDTPENNYADMRNHGKKKGEKHHLAKLTNAMVLEIRSRAASGETHQSIANSLNIQRRNVGKIVDGTRWGHVK